MGIIEGVAQTILDGFNRHYEVFRQLSGRARLHFEHGLLTEFKLATPFENLRRDVRNLERALTRQRRKNWKAQPNHQLQILGSLFFSQQGRIHRPPPRQWQ